MSCIDVTKNVEVELTDFEKDNLIQAYRILKNVSHDLFFEDADDTEIYCDACGARDCLESFLSFRLGIDVEED